MIIHSLLDTDLYKLTMGQAILQLYSNAWVKYKFKCRNKKIKLTNSEVGYIQEEIGNLCSLKFTSDELSFLKWIRFFKPFYLDFLRMLQLNRDYVKCWADEDGELRIEIEGPWMTTVYFEVPILEIVSEVCHRPFNNLTAPERLVEKILYLKENLSQNDEFKFIDFGSRRRYSKDWQRQVIEFLIQYPNYFVGTSNLMFAKEYNIKPIGTQAHEWFQAHQQLPEYMATTSGYMATNSQREALLAWIRVYQNDLGIALSDTLGFDDFLKDFNLGLAEHFDGCRHDSGDPVKWCNKLILHYISLGIDPKTKTAVFSDGLTFPEAVRLFKLFHKRINCSFGIGTNLTNDVGDEAALQIVIKMVECNGRPVAKISDSPGKGMCEDESYLKYLKNCLENK